MGYTLKLGGLGLTVFTAVALGTAAGNKLPEWVGPQDRSNNIPTIDVSPAEQAAQDACRAKGGLFIPKPATEGPLKGLSCLMPEQSPQD